MTETTNNQKLTGEYLGHIARAAVWQAKRFEPPEDMHIHWAVPETSDGHVYHILWGRDLSFFMLDAERDIAGRFDLRIDVRTPRKDADMAHAAIMLAAEELKANAAAIQDWPYEGWDEGYIYVTDVRLGSDIMHVEVKCLIET